MADTGPPHVPREPAPSSCLGCLGFGLAYLLELASLFVCAWRDYLLGVAFTCLLMLATMSAARRYRGLP